MIQILMLFISGPLIMIVTRSMVGKKETAQSIRIFFLLVYLFLAVFYFLTLLLGKYNFFIRGYRSTSILFILVALSGFVYWIIDRRDGFKPLRFLALALSLVWISLASCLLFEIAGDYDHQLYYDDHKYRLEDTRRGINEPCAMPILFVKNGIFERRFSVVKDSLDFICFGKTDIKAVKIEQQSDRKVFVNLLLQKPGDDQMSVDSLKATYNMD